MKKYGKYFYFKKLQCIWDIKRLVYAKFRERKYFYVKDKNKKPKT